MLVIELTTEGWITVLDFYAALKTALGAPDWHGSGIDAFIDSMIYGDINEIEAPYRVRITGMSALNPELRTKIIQLAEYIRIAREDFRENTGVDVDVGFSLED